MSDPKRLPLRWVAFLDARGRSVAVVAILVALTAGLLYSMKLGHQLPYIDELDYQAIAINVVGTGFYSSDGVEPNGDRAPVLPLVMAGVLALGGDVPQMRMINFLFYAVTLWTLYGLVRRLRQPEGSLAVFAGGLATLLAIAYPVLFYTAGTLFPQTVGAMLFVLFLSGLSRVGSPAGYLGIGLLFGLLLLALPMFLFTLPVILLWGWIVKSNDRLQFAACLLIGCGAVVSVWTTRNYLAFHMFVPLTSSSGAALLWGNAPEATIGGAEVDYLIKAYHESGDLNHAQADKFRLKLALEQMRHRKLAVLGFYFYKVLNHFSFVNDHYAKSEISIWRVLVMACTYLPLLGLLVVRLVFWKRYPPSSFEVLLIAIYLSTAFSYAIFHTRIRYRLPYDYALIALDALFIAQWITSRRTKGSGDAVYDRAVDNALGR